MKLVPNLNREDEVDDLFKLPLAEFTAARNELAAQIKKSGRGDEAAVVKALTKPTVPAWAVNQLYWNHREPFEKLLASGERFLKAQSSGKVGDMRSALDARRDALTQLCDLAARVLQDAGHNPSPDAIHRITTTLEGISAYASRKDRPRLGRLTHDVDPPGFESVGSFVPVAGAARLASPKKPETRKVEPDRSEEKRKAKIAAANASLRDAKQSLAQGQARIQSLEAAKTRVQAEIKQAQERLKDATRRARMVESDVKEAKREVIDAERKVEEAAKS